MSELRELIKRVRDEGHATVNLYFSLRLIDELQQVAQQPVKDERGRVTGWVPLPIEEVFASHGIYIRRRLSTTGYNDNVELILAPGQLEGRLM